VDRFPYLSGMSSLRRKPISLEYIVQTTGSIGPLPKRLTSRLTFGPLLPLF